MYDPVRVYITSIGLADIDLINSLVAVIRLKDYTPEKVYLMCGRQRAERLDHLRGAILDIISGYGGRTEVTPVTLDEEDFIAWGRKVVEIVKFEKERGNTVALDVTSGVKSMNIGATLAAWNKGIDHIFLFCQGEYDGSEMSIFDIPIQETHVHDFIQEAKQYERNGTSDKPA
jgi:hypothetical protein